MHIKRIRLSLPARFRHSAHLDAKRIAEEVAQQLTNQDSIQQEQVSVTIEDNGAQGSSIATQVGQQVAHTAKGNN